MRTFYWIGGILVLLAALGACSPAGTPVAPTATLDPAFLTSDPGGLLTPDVERLTREVETPTPTSEAPTPTPDPLRPAILAYAEHPCTLIRSEEIHWLLAATPEGDPVEDSQTDPATGALTGTCTYGDLAVLTLVVPGPEEDPQAGFTASLAPDAEELETRGDLSYWQDESRTTSVFTQNVWFSVQFVNANTNFDTIRRVPDVATLRLNGEDPVEVGTVPSDLPGFAPCPLITHAEAEAILGELISSGEGGSVGEGVGYVYECGFTRGPGDTVLLSYFYHATAAEAQAALQESRASRSADSSLVFDDLSGFGDAAFWEGWGEAHGLGVLHAAQGVVSLSLGPGGREEILQLAEVLLPRIAELPAPAP